MFKKWGGGSAWEEKSFSSLRFSFPTVRIPWLGKGKMWSTIKFKLMAGNALLYIKKELNVKTRIFPRSSFRSVPFVKKGIVKKKRNRYCIVQFLWIVPECLIRILQKVSWSGKMNSTPHLKTRFKKVLSGHSIFTWSEWQSEINTKQVMRLLPFTCWSKQKRTTVNQQGFFYHQEQKVILSDFLTEQQHIWSS